MLKNVGPKLTSRSGCLAGELLPKLLPRRVTIPTGSDKLPALGSVCCELDSRAVAHDRASKPFYAQFAGCGQHDCTHKDDRLRHRKPSNAHHHRQHDEDIGHAAIRMGLGPR